MGNAGAYKAGLEQADTTVEDSITGLMDKVIHSNCSDYQVRELT